ncbi:hypothetical protein OJAV_G00178700 [Oryzias javanicus]|uniref:Uncharacterized protein n=1 Tax=Oryzias javanicus TaxID=123683 RepID=A0A437CCY8_ORYJA|nr:hypothetical protein OJAV_G00178700 [Oryzias javanicus]
MAWPAAGLTCRPLRSSDYGTTYTKLNLMPGTTIVVTSFYICPSNKKKCNLPHVQTHVCANTERFGTDRNGSF